MVRKSGKTIIRRPRLISDYWPIRGPAKKSGAGRELAGLLRTLDRDEIALDSIEVRRPTLDDVFLTVTGRSLREEAA